MTTTPPPRLVVPPKPFWTKGRMGLAAAAVVGTGALLWHMLVPEKDPAVKLVRDNGDALATTLKTLPNGDKLAAKSGEMIDAFAKAAKDRGPKGAVLEMPLGQTGLSAFAAFGPKDGGVLKQTDVVGLCVGPSSDKTLPPLAVAALSHNFGLISGIMPNGFGKGAVDIEALKASSSQADHNKAMDMTTKRDLIWQNTLQLQGEASCEWAMRSFVTRSFLISPEGMTKLPTLKL